MIRNKIVIVFSVIAIFLSIAIFSLTLKSYTKNKVLTAQLQEADLTLGRAKTEIGALESKGKELSQDIQKEIKARKARETMYMVLEAKLKAVNNGKLTSPMPTLKPNEKIVFVDEKGKESNIKNWPFEFKDFRLKVSGDVITRQFGYTLSQQFRLKVIQTRDKTNNLNHYAELYEINPETGKEANKLELSKFEVIAAPENPTEKKFRFWDPKIDIQILGTVSTSFDFHAGFDLGFSIASYGDYRDPVFRFGRLGVGGNNNGLILTASPLQINVAKSLPVLDNIWLAPNIVYQLDSQSLLYGLGLGATL